MRIRSQIRAQVSIELILVMAAVVAIVLLLITQLQASSEKGINKLEQKTKSVFDEIDRIR